MVDAAQAGLNTATLQVASLQAPNADAGVAAVAAYLARALGQPVRVVDQADWQAR